MHELSTTHQHSHAQKRGPQHLHKKRAASAAVKDRSPRRPAAYLSVCSECRGWASASVAVLFACNDSRWPHTPTAPHDSSDQSNKHAQRSFEALAAFVRSPTLSAGATVQVLLDLGAAAQLRQLDGTAALEAVLQVAKAHARKVCVPPPSPACARARARSSVHVLYLSP